jgi:D-amino-acid dehydrogenase
VNILYGCEVESVSSDGIQARITVRQNGAPQTHEFDNIVVCAGIESRGLARQLGDRLNV